MTAVSGAKALRPVPLYTVARNASLSTAKLIARRTRTSSIGGFVTLSSQMRGTPGHGIFSTRKAGFFSSRGSDWAGTR